ncbi:MAG TPA: lysylphosphatidylglycerol synthase domain-containing protein [Gaiellaceae bacterium]|nr:lysylphosphatidylglycerol synthase domain-containing protein [Gaiellaceae bacterium]
MQDIVNRLGRRGLAAAGGLLVMLAVLVATPQLLGSRVDAAVGTLDDANMTWLWLAGAGFFVAVLASAGSWLSAIRMCGGRLSAGDACARYGAGSLVNTLVPARAGDAVRIGLFSRALPNRERLWTTGGAFAALGAARAVVLAALVVAGSLAGAMPLWPLLVLLGLVAVAVGLAWRARRRSAGGRLSHLLDAFRALGREPRAAVRLVAWIALSTAGRLAAATAVGAALGIRQPLAAAVVIVPALDLAGMMPLTPGNIGVTSGAIAMAFQAHGISFTRGLAAGIAFHAVETAVGILFGLSSVIWLAPYPSPGFRRLALVGATAMGGLAVAGAFSATVLVPLV